ncbi:AsnC family transcriptional regulator [Sphingorhabdus lutea]|uniref:AsnC family transcriptional regulator n=1 Tax=Sphingorhabdus lutea TaxID=1913578 RepID=A0A1L3JBB4_9SPHN|nr:Lrp/AsnC family transcriptional regulator [Sphingorhabdus lutea]APG62422.1 AsnC family transcriptional regulator [Sphingorhabdus lutea]
MDKIDYAIVRALQNNGRLTNQELAEKVNLSPSPCLRRVRNLENNGVIMGYGARINAKKFGLGITIFVHIKLEKHSHDLVSKFEQSIHEIDEVVECIVLSGQSDYLLRVMIKDLDAYDQFIRDKLQTIGGIHAIDSAFALSNIKQQNWYKPAS